MNPLRFIGAPLRSSAACVFLLLLPLRAADGLIPVDEASYHKVVAARHGQVVVANFWATWCEPCREEMPALAALAKKYRGRGVVLITISADEPEQEDAARDFLSQAGVPLPAYVKHARSDEDFINSVDASWSGALPALVLYDRTGRKAAFFSGETGISRIETALGKLL